MRAIISILVWLDIKIHKSISREWLGLNGYWITYRKKEDI